MLLLFFLWMQEPAPLSLAALIESAHARNGMLAAFRHERNALSEARQQARALQDPNVTLRVYGESVETRVGPQQASLNVTQALPYPGVRDARASVVDRRGVLVDAREQVARAELNRVIAREYFELYFLQQQRQIDEENLHLITRLEELARSRFRTGGGAYAVVIQAQTQLAASAERVNTSDAKIQAALAELTSLIGAEKPPFLGEIDVNAPLPNLFVGPQPTLAEMDARLGVFTGQDLLNRFDEKPSFKVGVTYIQTGEAVNSALPDSGQDAIIASVGVNLPIWKKRNRAKARQNLLERDAFSVRRDQLARDLRATAAKHRILLADTRRQIRLFEETLVPQARLALDSATQAFRTGAVPFSTLIEVQRDLLGYQLALARARTDEVQHRIDLAWLGEPEDAGVSR